MDIKTTSYRSAFYEARQVHVQIADAYESEKGMWFYITGFDPRSRRRFYACVDSKSLSMIKHEGRK